MNELIKEYAKREWPNNERMAGWVQKHTAKAMQFNGTILGIDKPHIETTMGFHDEGPNYDLYKGLLKNNDKMKEYFIYKNTKDLHKIVQTLEKENCMQYPYVLGVMYLDNGTARLSRAKTGMHFVKSAAGKMKTICFSSASGFSPAQRS